MRRLTVLSLSLLLVAAAPPKLTFEQAVKKCIKIVRAQSDKPKYPGFSHFDAYVTRGGTVRYIGNKQEMFQFEKCLDQHGHALGGDAVR